LEIEHLLDVSGHELADFVHDEDKGAAGTPPPHELFAAVGKEAGGHVGTVMGGFDP